MINQMTRPNIVIIKSDQHNARCLGINGHPRVHTPHLDALGAEGVNFTRAFVQNPICSPIREELRRTLFEWTQMTTRYANTLPAIPLGADGRATPAGLRALLEQGQWNYL